MIYIILPVHNRKETTEKFIKSLHLQTYKDWRLVIIDDGSIDGTTEMVLNYFPETVVLKGNGNLWWAGCLQKGFEWLMEYADDEDICLIINDDTVFDKNFLETAMNIISKTEKTLLLAQCYSQENNSLLDKGVHFNWRSLMFTQADRNEDINCLSTRGLFMKVADFKIIGGFHPIVLPHYLSDYEFTIRAFKKGFTLTTSENLKLYLDENTTGNRILEYKSLLDYYSKVFSNRNPSNPIHWLMFVWLAVPFPYKFYHTIRIFFRMIRDLIKPILKHS